MSQPDYEAAVKMARSLSVKDSVFHSVQAIVEMIVQAAIGGRVLVSPTALIVERDEDGECDMPFRNLGYEAREVEPQPCGKPAEFRLGDALRCSGCIGYALASSQGEGET